MNLKTMRFRQRVHVGLGLHLLIIFIYHMLSWIFAGHEVMSYLACGFLLAGMIFITIKIIDFKSLQHQYLEIYPGHELNRWVVLGLQFFPIGYLFLVGFLYFKKISIELPPFYFRKRWTRYAVMTPIIVFSFFYVSIGAWILNPSTIFILNTAHEVNELLELKNKEVPSGTTVIHNYIAGKGDQLSTSQLVMLTALSANDIIKKRERSIASTHKKENDLRVVQVMFKEMNLILKVSENSWNAPIGSFILWLSPAAVTELALLRIVEGRIRTKFNETLTEKLIGLYEMQEKSLKEGSDYGLKREFFELKKEFHYSKTYRSIASKPK